MARAWDNIIPYEDRSVELTTNNYRLRGIRTTVGNQNTDDGILWLKATASGDNVTCLLYKDEALANLVATAAAVDVSGTDNTGDNAVKVTFADSNSSQVTGSMYIRDFQGDATVPLTIALCTDEDLKEFFDDIESLPGYDGTDGMATAIRAASFDVISRVMQTFMDQLDGFGTGEAWYIEDVGRSYPDLRRLANPDQLRYACAYRALEIALRRGHQMADDTMYSEAADYWLSKYTEAISGIRLAFKPGSGENADEAAGTADLRMKRA